MARTQITPQAVDSPLSAEFSDTETTGSGMETAADLLANINNIVTMLKVFSGGSDWYVAPADDTNIFQTTSDNSRQPFLFRTAVVAVVTVSASQNWEVLSVASSEAPSQVAAVGAVTTEGAVVAYNSAFDTATLDEVTNTASALEPFNKATFTNSVTGDPINSASGFRIDALVQSESSTNGHTFDDTSNRVQLTFVARNAGGTDLVLASIADIAGATIQYQYPRRLQYQNLPEDAFLNPTDADIIAQAQITLSNAATQQSGNVVYTTKDINWVISASGDHFRFEDGSSNNIATFELDGSGNGDVTLGSSALSSVTTVNGDDFDVDIANTATLQAGLSVDAATAGTKINIGNTANQIDIAGNLLITATSGTMGLNSTSADLSITAITTGSVLVDGVDGVEINSASGGLKMGNDANTGVIDIGTGGAARVITIGNATSTTQLDFNAGTGGLTLDAISSDIDLTTTTSGDVTLTAAETVRITAECHTIDVAAAATGTLTAQMDKFHWQNAGVGDLYPKLNIDYTSPTATTSGFVVAYDGTGTTDTVAVGGFTAGVDGASDPTVATTGVTGFSAGDLVIVTGAAKECNNGLYEAVSHSSNVLTIRSTNDGVTDLVEAFTDGQFVTDSTVAGSISGITVTVLQADSTGAWGSASGSTTGFSFVTFGTAAGNTLQQSYVQGASIAVTSGEGVVSIANSADSANTLEISRTFAGGGTGLDIDLGTSATGTALIVDQNGSGNALDVRDGGTPVLLVTGGGAVTITPTTNTNATVTTTGTGEVQITSADTISLDAEAASNFTVDGGDLTVSTLTSGTLLLDAVALLDIDAGANIEVNVTGTFDMLSTGAFSIDGTGASNVTATNGNLTVSTLTTGDIQIIADQWLDADAGEGMTFDAGTASDASGYFITITGGVTSGAGNDAPAVTITAGEPGSGGAAVPVKLALPATNIDSDDPVVQFSNAGTDGHTADLYVRDVAADPAFSAISGSLAVQVNTGVPGELWLNDTPGTGSGTDWSRILTDRDNPITYDKTVAAFTTAVSANVNVSGTTTPTNLDATLGDYSGVTFTTKVNVYLDGQLQRNGANASANYDVYPGSSASTGDLMFEFANGSGSVVTMEIYSAL